MSEFYGIYILIFYNDHLPPHFHARYGDEEILIQISTFKVLQGSLPKRALNLVKEWANINHKLLIQAWEDAENNKKLQKIPPLS